MAVAGLEEAGVDVESRRRMAEAAADGAHRHPCCEQLGRMEVAAGRGAVRP